MKLLKPCLFTLDRIVQTAADTALDRWPVNPGFYLASVPAALGALLGADGRQLFYYVLLLMLVDLLSGLLRALILSDERVDWPRFTGGALGKLLMFCLLPVAHAMDFLVALSGVVQSSTRPLILATLTALAAHEGASIVQNVLRVKKDLRGALAPILRLLERYNRTDG